MSDCERKKDILSNLKIKSLYHITHIDNLESILKYGILSRDYTERHKIFF
ncbi:MAG: DarT ssDNA thymidine ADP-ribosyltransferase family protein [Thermoanaerobaculia bacterium]